MKDRERIRTERMVNGVLYVTIKFADNVDRKAAPSRGLGDMVSDALALVGVTEERVTKWLGRPCGCGGRRRKLNKLGRWARQVLAGERTAPPIDDDCAEKSNA